MDFKHALKLLLPKAPTVVLVTAGKTDERQGVFNPDGSTVEEVIGHKFSTFAGYPSRNVVGQRATGPRVDLMDATGTRFLGPEILGADPDPDQRNDIAICSAVEGAADALLALPKAGPVKIGGDVKIEGGKVVVNPAWPDQREEVARLKDALEGSESLLDFVVSELRGEGDFLAGKIPVKGGGSFARQLRSEMDFMRSLRTRITEER